MGAIAGVCSVVPAATPIAVSAGLLSMASGGISAWRGRLQQSSSDANNVLVDFMFEYKRNWREWARLSESEARDSGEIESAIKSFETYFHSEDPRRFPTAEIIVAQNRDVQKISVEMLKQAEVVYPSFYREHDNQGNEDQTTKFSRKFFLLVVQGGLRHLLALPEFAEILQPAMQDVAIETNRIVKENRQIGRDTLKTVQEVKSGQQELDKTIKSVVASFTSQLKLKDDQIYVREQQVAELTKAVAALANDKGNANPSDQIDIALRAISNGDTEKARSIFLKRVEADSTETLKTAEYYRHLGALAYFYDTEEALNAYRRSTELDPLHPDGWNSFGLVLTRTGDLQNGIYAFEKVLEIASSSTAAALGNIGVVYKIEGKLEKAEETLNKALEINESLEHHEGMANQYGDLGNICRARGELDKAENYYSKSLKIYENIEHFKGVANQYGNLGNVYQSKQQWEEASDSYLMSLKINELIKSDEGVAIQYGNLGVLNEVLGNLEKAEEYYFNALGIDMQLGHKEGMANHYGNLGNLYLTREEPTKAEEHYIKALEIDEALGRERAIAAHYSNLGLVYGMYGNPATARKVWAQAIRYLEIIGDNENLQRIIQLVSELPEAKSELKE